MRTYDGDRIQKIIGACVGAEASITGPEICAALDWPLSRQRMVRQIIKDEAALWPFIVCAKSGDGFFAATDVEEIEKYENWLLDLASSAQRNVSEFQACRISAGIHLPVRSAPAIASFGDPEGGDSGTDYARF